KCHVFFATLNCHEFGNAVLPSHASEEVGNCSNLPSMRPNAVALYNVLNPGINSTCASPICGIGKGVSENSMLSSSGQWIGSSHPVQCRVIEPGKSLIRAVP